MFGWEGFNTATCQTHCHSGGSQVESKWWTWRPQQGAAPITSPQHTSTCMRSRVCWCVRARAGAPGALLAGNKSGLVDGQTRTWTRSSSSRWNTSIQKSWFKYVRFPAYNAPYIKLHWPKIYINIGYMCLYCYLNSAAQRKAMKWIQTKQNAVRRRITGY